MRTFTANFLAQANSKSAKPYQVLQIDWAGATGTKYYLDRDSSAFDNADGNRVPASGIGNAKVMQWPSISISLKEGQVGATDQCSVVLNDASGELYAILNSAAKQRSLVSVWRMFDDTSVTWGTDKALMFTGILRPFDWSNKDNKITLNLGDLGPLLAKDVSCIANSSVFDKLPQASQDKNIPLCWGRAQRVEALPISVPWETKIAQSTLGTNPETVNITDDLSLLPGVVAETDYAAYLGTDEVSVKFHQSPDPASTLSKVTISVTKPPPIAICGAEWTGNTLEYATYYNSVQPDVYQNSLTSVVSAGTPVSVTVNPYQEITGATVSSITYYPPGTVSATSGLYVIKLNDNGTGDIAAAGQANVTGIKFLNASNGVHPWQSGTVLKAKDQTTIYAVSALPSKAVQIVEGFGTLTDSAGGTRKDFVVLGQIRTTTTVGSSTVTVTSDAFTVNLNDSTWNATLGRHITTITFPVQPRDRWNNLDDNRIWCTVLGVEDNGDSTGSVILNPATAILQYLENAHLMNVSAGSIDSTSFSDAATALIGYQIGFPQLETKPGLQMLQEMATQCSSVLFFDQGKAKIVVLTDGGGTIRRTFDGSTNDNILQGSLSMSETSVDDLVNEIVVKWTPYWDDITGKKALDVRNYKTAAISAFGRISRDIPVYMYWRRADVESQRDWWLNHLSIIFRTIRFTGFLDALILQPGDWITVTFDDGNDHTLSESAMVTKSTDTGKDGLVEIECRYAQVIY